MAHCGYATIGKRLEKHVITSWTGSEDALCAILEITQVRLMEYYSGQRNPLECAEKLATAGIDLNYLVTGNVFIGTVGIVAKSHCRQWHPACNTRANHYPLEGKTCAWYKILLD